MPIGTLAAPRSEPAAETVGDFFAQSGGRLRVLFAAPSPLREDEAPLDLTREWDLLRTRLLAERAPVALARLTPPTRATFEAALQASAAKTVSLILRMVSSVRIAAGSNARKSDDFLSTDQSVLLPGGRRASHWRTSTAAIFQSMIRKGVQRFSEKIMLQR